jgi:hypothetical protein
MKPDTLTMETLKSTIEEVLKEQQLSAPVADLEEPKEIFGIPVVPAVIGGSVAWAATGLVNKFMPSLPVVGSQLGTYGPMVVDLLIAWGLAKLGKRYEWAKYGALFEAWAAFQPTIQGLLSGVIPGGTAAATATAQEDSANMESNGSTYGTMPSELERWIHSRG